MVQNDRKVTYNQRKVSALGKAPCSPLREPHVVETEHLWPRITQGRCGTQILPFQETTVMRDVLFIGGRASRSSGNGSVTEQQVRKERKYRNMHQVANLLGQKLKLDESKQCLTNHVGYVGSLPLALPSLAE